MKNEKNYIVYKITNKINDNIYIGVHVTENINDKYMGSGSNIKKSIKEFGKENFEKIILYNFDTKEEMLDKERELVNEEFIKRNDTYNICLGGGQHLSINLINVKDKNNNNFTVHKTDPRYLTGELVGSVHGSFVAKDKNNKIFRVDIDDSRYLSGELVGLTKGKFVAKDKNNNIFQVLMNDPRYLSGELVGLTKGMVNVKDKNNNIFLVSITDPRYLSGELLSIWDGKKHKYETRKKMSIIKKGKYKGEKNSQYNTCWIYNEKLKQNKKIKKEELEVWVKNNWIKGRKINF
jgi:hypothetical protein